MNFTPEQIREAVELAEFCGRVCCCDDYASCPKHTFDPFTDANDDYLVLEAMRDKCGKTETKWLPDPEQSNLWFRFVNWLPKHPPDYTIGDYARAALKEIDNDT